MADLTTIQLQWLRDQLGDEPADAELQTRYDTRGSLRDVALSVLSSRRRELLESSLKVTATGIASVDNTENVKALERDMAALSRLDDDPTDGPEDELPGVERFSSFQLTRSRRR
jgi:hypothetical protein